MTACISVKNFVPCHATLDSLLRLLLLADGRYVGCTIGHRSHRFHSSAVSSDSSVVDVEDRGREICSGTRWHALVICIEVFQTMIAICMVMMSFIVRVFFCVCHTGSTLHVFRHFSASHCCRVCGALIFRPQTRSHEK
jgi:hypothetical protein